MERRRGDCEDIGRALCRRGVRGVQTAIHAARQPGGGVGGVARSCQVRSWRVTVPCAVIVQAPSRDPSQEILGRSTRAAERPPQLSVFELRSISTSSSPLGAPMRKWSVFAFSLAIAACKQAGSNTDTTAARNVTGGPAIVADARIATPNPPTGYTEGDWTMPARDYASSRYSTLAQITSANAKNLKASWTF